MAGQTRVGTGMAGQAQAGAVDRHGGGLERAWTSRHCL